MKTVRFYLHSSPNIYAGPNYQPTMGEKYVPLEVAEALLEALGKIEKWNRSKSNASDKREAISQTVEYAKAKAKE